MAVLSRLKTKGEMQTKKIIEDIGEDRGDRIFPIWQRCQIPDSSFCYLWTLVRPYIVSSQSTVLV